MTRYRPPNRVPLLATGTPRRYPLRVGGNRAYQLPSSQPPSPVQVRETMPFESRLSVKRLLVPPLVPFDTASIENESGVAEATLT